MRFHAVNRSDTVAISRLIGEGANLPVPESNPTLPPASDGTDPFTREGYSPSKVSVERTAMESGLPVTAIRPSKVHGQWVRNARTRRIVDQMLSGAQVIELANRGGTVDHLTAASNAAALIETVATSPGARILNIADPDPLTATEIVTAIGVAIGWEGHIVGLQPRRQAENTRGTPPIRSCWTPARAHGRATQPWLPAGTSFRSRQSG